MIYHIHSISFITGGYDCVECGDLISLLSDWNKIDNHNNINADDGSTSSDSSRLALPIGFDLIIAADTLIYIGQLGKLFKYISSMFRSLTVSDNGYTVDGKRGLFLFTTEDLDSSPMRLQREISADDKDTSNIAKNESDSIHDDGDGDGEDDILGAVPGWGAQMLSSARFAHSHRYIMQLCHKYKFHLFCHHQVKLRKEEGIELPGNVYLIQKM